MLIYNSDGGEDLIAVDAKMNCRLDYFILFFVLRPCELPCLVVG